MGKDIYLLGNKGCLSMPRIAVVGTRKMSAYGARVTEEFVTELVASGYAIVSGLALGVDALAHRTAIKEGGKTIAVLAHGLDYCYPPENIDLKQQIIDSDGLLVSAYPEGNRPIREQFLERNGLIVELSYSVLVTCCPHRSGVKNTVRYAAELGRDVYVVPGPITDSTYDGTIQLMRDGCIPVLRAQDIISE